MTVVDDAKTGSPEQSGKVSGFVPGQDSFVLSTGRLADAVGDPSSNASSALGQPGDDGLSLLSGRPTYDAATYAVRVIPQGSTLKVQDVFASEEYPEYVGSSFNDVMRVSVDGKDCSFVPGTSDPVAVNTVNQPSGHLRGVDGRRVVGNPSTDGYRGSRGKVAAGSSRPRLLASRS